MKDLAAGERLGRKLTFLPFIPHGRGLSSWLAGQEVRGSIPGLAIMISEIDYILLSSPDMAERLLK